MIRIGICGYGNLGKGVEKAIKYNPDMELVGIFSRRDIQTKEPLIKIEEFEKNKKNIDVVIMCGGSATDLPEQVPMFAKLYNTVVRFDTPTNIPEYYDTVDKINKQSNTVSLISAGWDPGLFSINRLYSEAIIPNGKTYTFWGKGVSQGHSDAIRRIKGVKNAIQYTIPIEKAIEQIRNKKLPELTNREKHIRECYVVLEENANKDEVQEKKKSMKNYFLEYDTIVHFITEEELKTNHSKMPHGGFVIHSGATSEKNKQVIEYSLKLDSNPEFTASVLVAYARAVYRLSLKGEYGAKTVLDIPPVLISPKTRQRIIKELL